MNPRTICLLIGFLVCGCGARDEPLSVQDRSAITNLVQKENIGGITEIELMRDGTVEVHTCVAGKDGGDLLTLYKTRKEWKIVGRGAWMH